MPVRNRALPVCGGIAPDVGRTYDRRYEHALARSQMGRLGPLGCRLPHFREQVPLVLAPGQEDCPAAAGGEIVGLRIAGVDLVFGHDGRHGPRGLDLAIDRLAFGFHLPGVLCRRRLPLIALYRHIRGPRLQGRNVCRRPHLWLQVPSARPFDASGGYFRRVQGVDVDAPLPVCPTFGLHHNRILPRVGHVAVADQLPHLQATGLYRHHCAAACSKQLVNGSHRLDSFALQVYTLVACLLSLQAVPLRRGRLLLYRPASTYALQAAITTSPIPTPSSAALILTCLCSSAGHAPTRRSTQPAGVFRTRFALLMVPPVRWLQP